MDLEETQVTKALCLSGLTAEQTLEEGKCFVRIRVEIVRDFTEAYGMDTESHSMEAIAYWIFDMGHLSSAVNRSYDKKKTRAEIRAETSMHEVKFTLLRENEQLEDFFSRLDSYFERIKASESNKLGHIYNLSRTIGYGKLLKTPSCK
jgi:hypothetical protein